MAPQRMERNDTRVDLLLPKRARSECARSTAAVRPDTGAVPEKGKRASLEGAISGENGARARWEGKGAAWLLPLRRWKTQDGNERVASLAVRNRGSTRLSPKEVGK